MLQVNYLKPDFLIIIKITILNFFLKSFATNANIQFLNFSNFQLITFLNLKKIK